MQELVIEVDSDSALDLTETQIEETQRMLIGIFQNTFIDLKIEWDSSLERNLFDQVQLPLILPSLYALTSGYRRSVSSEAGWRAQVLVCPRIFWVPNGEIKKQEFLGAMFNGERPRQVIAVAATPENRPFDLPWFVRTMAHELGHLLNLQHPHLATCPSGRQDRSSIMVPSFSISSGVGDLAFFPCDLKWLEDATRDYAEFVRPGGRSFKEKPAEYCAAVESVEDCLRRVATSAPLRLSLSTAGLEFSQFSPIHLNFKLENESNGPLDLFDDLSLPECSLEIQVKKPSGRSHVFRAPYFVCRVPENRTVSKNNALHGRTQIFLGREGTVFQEVGEYTVRAQLRTSVKERPAIIYSDPHTFAVRRMVPDATSHFLRRESLALFLVLRGGQHIPGAVRLAEALLETKPDKVVADDVRLALASSLILEKGDRFAARELLDGVSDDYPHGEYTAELELLRYLASPEDEETDSLKAYSDALARFVPNPEVVAARAISLKYP